MQADEKTASSQPLGPEPTKEYWTEQKRLCKTDQWHFHTYYITFPGKRYWSREEFDYLVDRFNNGPSLSMWRRSRVNYFNTHMT